MSEEDAAKMTWTGRQVAEFGFTQVRVLSPLAELPGIGLDVQVLFTKPSGA